ncbi:MAG: galactose-1-phosphate uridylyltransferase [Candidatus Lokiarchaeota archaeon]|nr:galactose-1-phosphate uridylyltransferase [Candidatus Lokiarchaeota archaeon]
MSINMVELRWNAILKEWVVVAGHRMKRPNLPSEIECPFCPKSNELKNIEDWKYLNLPNKFPSLMEDPPEPDLDDDDINKVKPAFGRCEVVLYSPEHNVKLEQLPNEHVSGLFSFLGDRYKKIGENKNINYVLIFENRGRDVGVSLDHPHGQIYSFSFIPPVILKELNSSKEFFEEYNKCLFCTILKKEQDFKKRIILENDSFICFMPHYATWPFGPHIYPKNHIQNINQMTQEERENLAKILKEILNKISRFFNGKHSFEMIFHQEPTDGNSYPYYHFHIEFYVINRAQDKIKYLGGCELGSGIFINPVSPEDAAIMLKNI